MFEITVMKRPFRGADVEILDSVKTDESDISKVKRQATKMLKPFTYENKVAGTWAKNFSGNWTRHESVYASNYFVEISEVEETPEVKPVEFVNTVQGDTLTSKEAERVRRKEANRLAYSITRMIQLNKSILKDAHPVKIEDLINEAKHLLEDE